MKKGQKRIISFLLTVILLCTYEFPIKVMASEVNELMPKETMEQFKENDEEKGELIVLTGFETEDNFTPLIYMDNDESLEKVITEFPDSILAYDQNNMLIEVENVQWVLEDSNIDQDTLNYVMQLPQGYVWAEYIDNPKIIIERKTQEVAHTVSENDIILTNAAEMVEDGTQENPYLIYTVADFDKLRNHLESGNYFKLMNDLDAKDAVWEKVGTSTDKPFSGNFDGNGHCIYNLECLQASNWGGVFGYLDGADIHDLGIKVRDDVTIVTDRSAGILCMLAKKSKISRCYVIGDIKALGGTNVGLFAYSFLNGEITECYAQGSVYGESTTTVDYRPMTIIGGITGVGTGSTIKNCFAAVYLESASNNAYTYLGGICGYNVFKIENCLFLGETFAHGQKIIGQIYGEKDPYKIYTQGCYYAQENSADSAQEKYGYARSIEELRQQRNYTWWDFDSVWILDDITGFPKLRNLSIQELDYSKYVRPYYTDFSARSGETILSNHISFSVFFDRAISVDQNEGIYFVDTKEKEIIRCTYSKESENELLIQTKDTLQNGHTYKLVIADNCIYDFECPGLAFKEVSDDFIINVCKESFKGEGSPENPYVISTAEQLNCVYYQPTCSYVLAEDIDASKLSGIQSIGACKSGTYSMWGEIYPQQSGDVYEPFSGTFDGKGFTISGIKSFYGNTITGDAYNTYVALFASTKDATIQNLNIVLADDFYRWEKLGGNIISYAYYPCIAGLVAKGTGTIQNCTVRGDIYTVAGTRTLGLLAGEFDGTIEKCATYGVLTNGCNNKDYSVGGLVGHLGTNGKIRNCYSMAAVYGTGNNVAGGFVGINDGQIEKSYFAGYVNQQTQAGGFAGRSGGKIMDSYYDCLTSGMKDQGKGTPKVSSAMKSTETFVGWDFINCWAIQSGINNGYPYLLGTTIPKVFDKPTSLIVYDGTDTDKTVSCPEIIIYEDGKEIQRYAGDENGVINLDGITVSKNYEIKITAEGYIEYNYKNYPIKAFSIQSVKMFPVSENPTIYCANFYEALTTEDAVDVLQKKKALTSDDQKTYLLEVFTYYAGEISDIYLIQGGKIKASAIDGVITLKAGSIVGSEPIYLKAVSEDGKESELYRIYLSAIKIVNGSVGIGEEGIEINIPDNIPLLGGLKLNVTSPYSEMKRTKIDVKNGKVRYTINLFDKKWSEKETGEIYDLLEDTLKCEEDESVKSYFHMLNDFVEEYGEIIKDQYFMSADAGTDKCDLKCKIFGYIEYDIATNKVCEGKIALYCKAANSLEAPFSLIGLPCVLIIGFDGSVEGGATATLYTPDVSWNYDLDAKVKLSGGVGPGVPKLASFTYNGSGELEMKWMENKKASYGSTSVDLTTDVYWKAKVLCFEMEKSFAKKTYNLYSHESGSINNVAMENNVPEAAILKVNAMTNESEWNQFNINSRSITGIKDCTILENVYDNSTPQIVSTGNDMLMVYIHQNETRSVMNATEVVYSVYNSQKDEWVLPKTVDDDGTADFYPQLVEDDGEIYLTWLNISDVVEDENITLDRLASRGKAEVARYNFETGNFEKLSNEETGMLATPRFCAAGKYVLWLENKTGHFLDNSNMDLIVTHCEKDNIQEKKTVVQGVKNILDAKIETINEETVIAYLYDEDGNYNTINDHILCEVDLNGNIIYQSEKGEITEFSFATLSGEKLLTYAEKGSIYTVKANKNNILFETTEPIYTSYQIVNGATDYIIFKTKDQQCLMAYIYDSSRDNWSNAVTLLESQEHIADYEVADYNDQLKIVYQILNADTMNAELHIRTVEPLVDLKISSLICDETTSKVEINMDVLNNGLKDADGYIVTVYDGSSVLFKDIVNAKMLIGQSVHYQNSFESVNILGYEKTLTLEVVPLTETDANLEDNIGTMLVGFPDIELSIEDEIFGENAYSATVGLCNIGNYATDGVINVYIYDRLIDTISVDSLPVEEKCQVNIAVDMDEIDIEDSVGIIKVEYASNLHEKYVHNNYETSNVYMLMNATLGAISAEAMNLNVGESKEVIVQCDAASGSNKRIALEPMRFVMQDTAVATVDETGFVRAVKEGETQLEIEATDKFGNVANTVCTVVVSKVSEKADDSNDSKEEIKNTESEQSQKENEYQDEKAEDRNNVHNIEGDLIIKDEQNRKIESTTEIAAESNSIMDGSENGIIENAGIVDRQENNNVESEDRNEIANTKEKNENTEMKKYSIELWKLAGGILVIAIVGFVLLIVCKKHQE